MDHGTLHYIATIQSYGEVGSVWGGSFPCAPPLPPLDETLTMDTNVKAGPILHVPSVCENLYFCPKKYATLFYGSIPLKKLIPTVIKLHLCRAQWY